MSKQYLIKIIESWNPPIKSERIIYTPVTLETYQSEFQRVANFFISGANLQNLKQTLDESFQVMTISRNVKNTKKGYIFNRHSLETQIVMTIGLIELDTRYVTEMRRIDDTMKSAKITKILDQSFAKDNLASAVLELEEYYEIYPDIDTDVLLRTQGDIFSLVNKKIYIKGYRTVDSCTTCKCKTCKCKVCTCSCKTTCNYNCHDKLICC